MAFVCCAGCFDMWFQLKVEPYSIPGSFLKLKYLKTELNVDNRAYAIVYM